MDLLYSAWWWGTAIFFGAAVFTAYVIISVTIAAMVSALFSRLTDDRQSRKIANVRKTANIRYDEDERWQKR